MSGVNKVILIGHIGKDPELKYLEGNIARLSFSLATTEVFIDKTGKRSEHTEWHNLVMWRQVAENAVKILKKGMLVYFEGKLQTRQWNDKTGNSKNITEIVADTFNVLQTKESSSSAISSPFPSKLTD